MEEEPEQIEITLSEFASMISSALLALNEKVDRLLDEKENKE